MVCKTALQSKYKIDYSESELGMIDDDLPTRIERGTSVHNPLINLTGTVLNIGEGKVTVIIVQGKLDWETEGLEVVFSD